MNAEVSPRAFKVAVLGGTGRQGFGLALRWAAAGVPVAVGSRDPSRAVEATQRIARSLERAGKPPAAGLAGLTNAEAASWADAAVLTVPASALEALLQPLAPVLVQRVVIDVSVSLTRHDGRWQAILPPEGSTALRVQALLGGHRQVAAALHTVSSALLADLSQVLAADDTPIFAASPEAADVAAWLAKILGLRPVLAGDLRDAAAIEHVVALLLQLGQRHRRQTIGIRFTHLG